MLGKITEMIFVKNIEKKLKKYDIKMVHFVPGRIRLQSSRWIKNGDLIERIIDELNTQPFVFSVNFTEITGSVVITYDANHVTENHELESWFQILEQVYTTEFLQ
ncbi:HMA2 domain-containing protein [Neobacillus niacini]|uniref:HMA2 domain-containing protein n=1 Tax=Neobacillus niacini TaxID=86668 RepID=UPI0021CB12FF|nr:metal ABC transporter ATPase [Neobacillus niacini]MCM3766435.1 metal ABC transporter ATPase [Neobacillus niacini]